MHSTIDEPTVGTHDTYPLAYSVPALLDGRRDGTAAETRTVTVSAPPGAPRDSRPGWTVKPPRCRTLHGAEADLERRVRRLRDHLKREGMRLLRRGDGFAVTDTETGAVLSGDDAQGYSLSLEGAEGYLGWFDHADAATAHH